jgi:Uma2 family endonuclease
MAMTRRADTLKLVRQADGLELDMQPLQGLWTDEQYLALTDTTRRLIEFTDGVIEVLPMPTERHQIILARLYEALVAHLRPLGGIVLFAALRLRIRAGKYREPDILLLRDARDSRRDNRFWLGADLVVEIVSPDDPERDTVDKRADYATARVPEYWIVDPVTETITVLTLADGRYIDHVQVGRGDMATSALLAGFSIAVDAVFDAA